MVTLFPPMQPVTSSSAHVRRTRTPGPGIFAIVMDTLFCTIIFVFVYLILANFKYYKLSKSLSSNKKDHEASVMMGTSTTDASFLLALMHLMNSGIDDLDYGAAGILLLVCNAAPTALYVVNRRHDFITGFFDLLRGWSFSPTKRYVTAVTENSSTVNREPPPDAPSYHANANNCIRGVKKSKSRIWYVPRRRSSNPLRRRRHPLSSLKLYRAASKIKSPGWSFVKAGRALPTIPEDVHFLEESDDCGVDDDSVEEVERPLASAVNYCKVLVVDEDDNDDDDDDGATDAVCHDYDHSSELHFATATPATLDTELSIPTLLGSTFVNGRRRSSRHLAVKPEDATKSPCSGLSRKSRRG